MIMNSILMDRERWEFCKIGGAYLRVMQNLNLVVIRDEKTGIFKIEKTRFGTPVEFKHIESLEYYMRENSKR